MGEKILLAFMMTLTAYMLAGGTPSFWRSSTTALKPKRPASPTRRLIWRDRNPLRDLFRPGLAY